MAAYFLRLVLCLIPAAVLLSVPGLVLWRLREFVPPSAIVAAAAHGENILIGQGYWPMPADGFVLAGLASRKPAIVALGNSRVLEFRAPFFKGKDFFNAGGTVGSVAAFRAMLQRMPEGQRPKVVILGLEQSFFAQGVEPAPVVGEQGKQDSIPTYMSLWSTVYKDLVRGKIPPAKLWSIPDVAYRAYGVNAVVNGNGLRKDGSYYYGRRIGYPDEEFDDSGFRDTFRRIEKGCCRFEPSSDVNQGALAELAALLDYCANEGIYTVGFLPAYPRQVLDKMRATGKYGYQDKLVPAIGPLFASRSFPLFDFTDLRSTGAADGEYIDGLHASEKAYLRMWIKMAESDRVLAAYADLPELKRRLAEATGDFEVFGPQE